MKLKILFATFYISAPILLLLRLIQRFYIIDNKTGLIDKEYLLSGTIISIAFFAIIPVIIIMSILSQFKNIAVPTHSNVFAIGSFLLAAALVFDSALTLVSAEEATDYLLSALTLIGAIAFAWQGICQISDLALPKILPLLSVIWMVARVITVFIKYTGEVTVTDCYFHVVTLCLVLLTLWLLAKMSFGIVSSKSTTMLFGFGLSAVIFSADHALPNMVAIFTGNKIHNGGMPDVVSIAMVFYILFALHAIVNNKEDTAVSQSSTEVLSTTELNDVEISMNQDILE